MAVTERSLLVLFGSQTGCAQEVAERIAWEGKRRHFRVRLAGKFPCNMRLHQVLTSGFLHASNLTIHIPGMDEYDVMNLPSEPLVIACASTTGQGDAPDNMRSFWSFLLRRSLGADSLVGTSFAVFGLGDSGYAKYNAAAKRLDKRLEMLGLRWLDFTCMSVCQWPTPGDEPNMWVGVICRRSTNSAARAGR